MKKPIGLIIREIIENKNLSVIEVADKMQMTRQNVYQIYGRKKLPIEKVEQWAKVLQVSSDYLLAKEGALTDYDIPKLPDDYLMKYVAELEARIKEQSQQLDMQNETIRVLLGKSKANGLRLSRGVVGSKAPIFLRIPV